MIGRRERTLASGLALALGLAACGDDLPSPGEFVEVTAFPAVPSRELDVLILVDNSSQTLESQFNFATAMTTFVAALDALDGGRPSLHIGVATSDLGTTGADDFDHPAPPIGSGRGSCAGHGNDGVLQASMATLADVPYVRDEPHNGGRVTNYTDGLASVLGQMVKTGADGCGFEQPLAGIQRALTNPLNTGFVRPTANLAVIVIADEDDCSIRDPGFFAANAALGPLDSFRCSTQGVVCDEPIDTVGTKTNCRAREDSMYVADVQSFAAFLTGMKAHPQQLAVAAIVGSPTPVAVALRTPPGGVGDPTLALSDSCMFQGASGVSVAAPAVRIADWLTRLPGSPTALATVCQRDLSSAATSIGQIITRSMSGDSCIDSTTLVDASGATGFQLNCKLVDIADSAPEVETPIPQCDAVTAIDCFEIIADAAYCPHTEAHLRVAVQRSQPASPGTWSHLRCQALAESR